MATLIRLNDNKTVSGKNVDAVKWKEDNTFGAVVGHKPVVGSSVLVGNSIFDYWLTTVVTEILEEREDEEGKQTYVKFKTLNSIYELHY
jgi:hypothetical protein